MQNTTGNLLAIMTVEITSSESDIIYIYEKDDPRDLAILFASKHDLPGRYLLKLVDSITQHKKQAQHTLLNEQKPSHQKSNYFRNSAMSTPYKQQNSQISTQSGVRKSPQITTRSACRNVLSDGKIIRDNSAREIKSDELTFTPQINKNSELLVVRYFVIQKQKNPTSSVEQRLINYGKKKEIHLQELRMQKQHEQEQQNKSFTYQPKTTQRSHEILNEKGLSKSVQGQQFVLNLPCPDQNIVQQVWKASLKRLFNMLDKEQNGQLSAEQVDLSQLSYEMLQIVAPILLVMEERGGAFKFEDFAKEVTNYCVKHNFVENLFSLLLQ